MTVTEINDGYKPLTAVQVEEKLRQAVRDLETATDAYSAACDQAAEAEYQWKLAEAKTVVLKEGPVSALERRAKVDHEDYYHFYKVSAGVRDAALERVRSARAVLSAVQTAAGSFRDQFGAANQAGWGA